jgi:protein-L-isoaspartate(D-aspartate) O-methyltransferase
LVLGDGRKGWKEGAPYDAIHVGAAAAEHHQVLEEQLKAPGRMFVPVEEGWMQHIYVVDKKEDGSVEKKKLYGVQYVPLTDAPTG